MAVNGINGINFEKVSSTQNPTGQTPTQMNNILSFAERSYGNENEPSEAKIKTEVFKFDIMSKLDIPQSKTKYIRYYLNELLDCAQALNGVQKNQLKPNGTPEQNRQYHLTIQEKVAQMNDYAQFVGSGLSIVQDSKTGLYKLCIDNKLYDIPERKVEIVPVDTEEGYLLEPKIVD